eukprot:comp16902_c0_seq1/m.27647 comp16902_c0_seq1/g.27647  ORF comp16902_c0_seq1/g.27647 comp16902_c0_seq1/m.27647 type:complete len:143 (+) comp16902_c0_seq1:111-539(+)
MTKGKVVNVRVGHIRPKYANLAEWMLDSAKNEYIGRKGVVFVNGSRFPKVDSVFANPFKISPKTPRSSVIADFREYIETRLQSDPQLKKQLLLLRGKNLGCWCAPDKCHGDVLLELIEKYRSEADDVLSKEGKHQGAEDEEK